MRTRPLRLRKAELERFSKCARDVESLARFCESFPGGQLTLHSKPYYLSISTMIHLIIFLLIGGVVLFKTEIEPPDFAAGSGDSFLIETEDTSALPPAATSPSLPTAGSFPIQAPTPSIAAITTTAPGEISLKIPTSLPASARELTRFIQGKLARLRTNISIPAVSEHWRDFFGRAKREGRKFLEGPEAPEDSKLLEGTFYDLKQLADGRPSDVTTENYGTVIKNFARSFRESVLDKYFKAPTKLYAGRILIPVMPAEEAPKAFNVSDKVRPSLWVILYKGRVRAPESGTFRFVGTCDDILLVRFGGKFVLEGSWVTVGYPSHKKAYFYDAFDNEGLQSLYRGFSNGGHAVGSEFQVHQGSEYEIEILIGEGPGGNFFADLHIEKLTENYAQDNHGNPLLPYFQLTPEPVPPNLDHVLPPYRPEPSVWPPARFWGS